MDATAPFNSTNDPSSGDIAQASVVIIIGTLVCFCSLLTIIVVQKFRSVSNPDILILALAIFDFISSFTVFPMAAYWYLRTGAYPTEICLVFGVLTTTIQLASTVIVSLMTVDRFLAIRRPILYRTRLCSHHLKRLVVIIVVVSAVIGCLPAVLSSTKWTNMTIRHGYCTFQYSSDFTFVILAISLPQIPLLLYCYYGFLVSIRKFIQRRQPHQVPSPASSSVSSSEVGRRNIAARLAARPTACHTDTGLSRCRIYCCCFCCGIFQARQTKPASKEEMVERTQTMMKNLNLKRCTRMSKTVALVVVIYYTPWLLALITMMIELITRVDNYSSGLNLLMVRLMMAHSIFYPAVYATLCVNYRQAYKWALSLPFHPCGLEWHERPPLGISVSEMHRISHQMALEEWESPGLNRRLYSKRPYLKRSATDSLKGAANVESDTGQDNAAFERHEITSSDRQAAEDGLITVETVHEIAAGGAIVDNLAPSVSVNHIVPVDSPPLPNWRPRVREEKKQGVCAPRRPLENQTSDSGVDVDSIHLDSAPSGSNSPAVIRLQTVESESSTSVSDATEHLIRVEDARYKETSFALEPNDQNTVKSTHCAPKMKGSKASDSCDKMMETRASDSCDRSSTKHEILINGEERSEHVNENLEHGKHGVRTANDDAGKYDTILETRHIAAETDAETSGTAEKSKLLDFNSSGYSIKETSAGKNSILRITPCSAGEHCQGVVRIHVEVVELRPDSPPLSQDTCTLQSSTRQCRVKSANKKPSLKFCMQKNRFVPSTSSFEETDSFSINLGGQNVDNAKKPVATPQLNLPDADDASQNGEMTDTEAERETMATNGDVDEGKVSDDPPAKGFKNRRMRASRALRESARYDDDIVRFSEMIMRRQNEDKLAVKEVPTKTEATESLLVPDGSKVTVTDHIDL